MNNYNILNAIIYCTYSKLFRSCICYILHYSAEDGDLKTTSKFTQPSKSSIQDIPKGYKDFLICVMVRTIKWY